MNLNLKTNLTASELFNAVEVKTSFAERDLAEFTTLGYDAEKMEALKNFNQEVLALPQDSVFVLRRIFITREKNTKRDELKQLFEQLRWSFMINYGRNTELLNFLKLINFDKISDEKMVQDSFHRIALVEEHLGANIPAQVSDILAQTKVKLTEYTALQVEISQLKSARPQATVIRLAKMNELYDRLMDLCMLGKMLWKHTDSVKYNDYIVHK